MNADAKAYLFIAAALGIFFTLWFLHAMFAREAVKRELLQHACTPVHIWWRPLAFWATRYRSMPFRVVYRDADSRLHKAYCCVYTALMDSPFGSRRVEWIKDEVRSFIDL